MATNWARGSDFVSRWRHLVLSLAYFAFTTLCIGAQRPETSGKAREGGGHSVPWTIEKEPSYRSVPRYALLELGSSLQTKVWMVEDGQDLYIDRNCNRDLTDDGPPLQPSKGQYTLDAITTSDGSRHTDFQLHRWNSGEKDDTYGLQLKVNGQTPMYAGWFGTFWALSKEQVRPVHLGGQLLPRLMTYNEFTAPASSANLDARWFQGFPTKPFSPGRDFRRLALAFVEPGGGDGAESRLSIDALPPDAVPEVEIDWPVAEGAKPLRTTHRLTKRCCYWVYYDSSFVVPKGVVPGQATVTVSLSKGAFPLPLKTNKIEVPVVEKEIEKPVR